METEEKSRRGKCGALVKACVTEGCGGRGMKKPQLCDVTVARDDVRVFRS